MLAEAVVWLGSFEVGWAGELAVLEDGRVAVGCD